MSRQPFLNYQARTGWRLESHELLDGTLSLITDPFGRYPMGYTAERVAKRYGIGRDKQDAFAVRSHELAVRAIEHGVFDEQIVAVEPPGADEPFALDEHPRAGITLEKLAKLPPVFEEGGTVTAGNSSGINDGAAAVVLLRASEAERRGSGRGFFCGRGR